MKKRIVANPFNMILSGAFLLGMAAYCAFMGAGVMSIIGCALIWCVIEWVMNVVSLSGDEQLGRRISQNREKALSRTMNDSVMGAGASLGHAWSMGAFAGTTDVRLEERRKLIPASWAVVLGAGLLMAILIEDSLGNAGSVDIGKYGFLFALIFLGFALDLAVSSFRGKKRSGL